MADINPYAPRTTMTIDRANRLIGLKSHPGFNDFVALINEVVKVAEDAFVSYEGWDNEELVARSIAFRAAKKFEEQLLTRMGGLIQAGIAEAMMARDANPQANNADAADGADELRAAILTELDNRYETRVSGTY
jgi:hypothetical protein